MVSRVLATSAFASGNKSQNVLWENHCIEESLEREVGSIEVG